MKKSDITRIIKEEIVAILRNNLNEDFADPIAREIHKKLGARSSDQQKLFNAIAKKYDIAWDKVPAGSFQDITGDSTFAKTGLVFYMSDRRQKVGDGWNQSIDPGLLAVTLDGKTLYYGPSSNRGYGAAPADAFRGNKQRYKTAYSQGVTAVKTSGTGVPLGQGVRGTLQLKKLIDLADKMYRFDLESYRGGTTAMKAQRVELKAGTKIYHDAKAYRQANIDRYNTILSTRVTSKDSVDALVKDGMQIINDAIMKSMELIRMSKFGEPLAVVNDKDIKMSDLAYMMNKIFQAYEQYIYAMNNAAEAVKRYGDNADNYENRRMREMALSIKKIVTSLKAGKV